MTMHAKEEMSGGRPEIDLTGPKGNAMVLMAMARHWAKDLDKDGDVIIEEMMSGDYENLLEVLEREFGDFVDFYR